jgi:membrane protein DedA with SNARE-associated domain
MIPVADVLPQIHLVAADFFAWEEALSRFARHWIEAHGYFAMAALLFASGAGLPLPEDVPLIAAGVCVARGTMTWALAASVAWVAMMFGDTSLYILGFILGWRVVHLPMIGRHVTEKRLKRCQDWFNRWGIWAVGIGRMVAGVRSAMVVAAGTMRFNYFKLLMADGLAAIGSGGMFMYLGYWAGKHSGKIGPIVEHYRRILSLSTAVLALTLAIILWVRTRRRVALAAAARAAAPALSEVAPGGADTK